MIRLIICFLLVTSVFSSCKQELRVFQNNEDSWKSYGNATWSSTNKELKATVKDGEGYLVTDNTYEDFSLELDFKPSTEINSGVFLRCKDFDINPDNCYEFNIWDNHTNENNRTGALVRRARPFEQLSTINKWNTYKIDVKGFTLKAYLNDTLVVHAKNAELKSGHIGLQAKGTGEIEFKNIKLVVKK